MTKYLFYAIIETKKGYLMKIRIPAALLAVIMIIAAFPVSAHASFTGTRIKLRSPYQDCMNHRSGDSYNYNNDSHDYVTPYDSDTDKISKRTGTSLTIHWYPVYGASGYEVCNKSGKVVKRISGMDVNQITVTGLKENTKYTFTVRAYKKKNGEYTYTKRSKKASGYTGYKISGKSSVSAAQMARYYRSKRSSYPSAYKSLGAATIDDFTRIVYNEAKRYNIKAEVLFAQMMNETGFLKFGGDVSIYQCNFGGVGAVGNGASGLDFRSYAAAHYKAFGYSSASQAEKHAIEVGIRSQAMHLSLYAGAIRRIDNTIDPRGRYVRVGNAPYVQWLGIKDNPYTTGEKHSPSYRAQTRGWAAANNYGYTLVEKYIRPMKKA